MAMDDQPRVRALGPPQEVPVYNCIVNIAPATSDGSVIARAANIAGMEGRGRNEREAIAQVVSTFKMMLKALHAAGEPIPWLPAPTKPLPNEKQLYIAVHL